MKSTGMGIMAKVRARGRDPGFSMNFLEGFGVNSNDNTF